MRLRTTAFCAACLAVAFPAIAGDASFQAIVSRVEQNLGVRRTHVPMLGLASLIVRVARPAGVSSLRLAIFEDISSDRADVARSFREAVERAAGGWRPMIRVSNRNRGEQVAILSRGMGNKMHLLIASVNDDDAVLLEVKVSPETLARWLNDEQELRRGIRAAALE